jgi:hypothetical protein
MPRTSTSRKSNSDQRSPATVQEVVQFASQLSSPKLDELIAALLALREALDQEELNQEESAVQEATASPSSVIDRKGKAAHIAWKMINGYGPYPYLRFRDEGTYRSYYLKGLRKPQKSR